jgi:hypothetical protein
MGNLIRIKLPINLCVFGGQPLHTDNRIAALLL